jgi:hypothetical protein
MGTFFLQAAQAEVVSFSLKNLGCAAILEVVARIRLVLQGYLQICSVVCE